VDRLAVRDDDVLERKLEELPQGGEGPHLVSWRPPDEEHALRRRERVGEHEDALLGSSDRRLVPAAAVIDRREPARQRRSGL
jgi:hypothetical protein